MSRYLLSIVVAAVASGVGCTYAEPNQETPNILSSPLQEALKNYDQLLREKKPDVAFTSGEVAKNCHQYIHYSKQSSLMETSENMTAAQDYVICRSAVAVRAASGSSSPLNDIDVAAALAERVDIRSFPSSLYQQTEDDAFTLAAMPIEVSRTSAYSVQVEREDWQYELSVAARLDLDGDGDEDWLIWLEDRALAGSYDIIQPYIAYNIARGVIELEPIP